MNFQQIDKDFLIKEAFSIAKVIFKDQVLHIKKIPIGVMTHKFLIQCKHQQNYIIRFYPQRISYVINYEPDLFKRAFSEGAKVPEVVYDSRETQESFLPYILYKKIPGQVLSAHFSKLSISTRSKIINQIWCNLEKLHELSFEGYGPLINDKKAQMNGWNDFVDKNIEAGLPYLSKLKISEKKLTDYICNFKKEYANYNLYLVKPTLVWSDLSLDNIIINKNNLSGFVDFDGVFSGDILLEIGYLFAREGNSIFYKALLDEYKNLSFFNPDIVTFYTLLRFLRIAKYLSEPLPTGARRMPLQNVFPGLYQLLKHL